ncbi:hypothetical protein [Yoonia sp. SS1-5]|uniref:Porin n=1 Tax=Yoonia rhodophyticola TaxID=3137370 RepID=A0AAN0MAV7_9RHOB
MTIKTLILAAAAASITASASVADTYFQKGRTLDAGSTLDLGLITAEGNGVVAIYDYHRGERGALLGTEQLSAGANTDVRVNTGLPTKRDVIAVISVDGQEKAAKDFVVN